MAVREVSVREARKRLEPGKLSFLLFFFTGLMAYMLTQITSVFESLVWYAIFMVFCLQYVSTVNQIEGRRNFLVSVYEYDIHSAWPPIFIWGIVMFIIFGFFSKSIGATISFPGLETLFQQVLVASSETIIFAVLLPEAIRSYGRIPFTDRKIPGWFWGAGVYFALFHIPAYAAFSPSLTVLAGRLFFVFCMGIVFYTLYKYGDKNKNVGGITAAISLHWVWNIWAISTTSVIMF